MLYIPSTKLAIDNDFHSPVVVQVQSEPSQNVLLVALSSDDSLHRVEVPPPPYEYDEDTPRNEQV